MIDQDKRGVFGSQDLVRFGLISHHILPFWVDGGFQQASMVRRRELPLSATPAGGCEEASAVRTKGATRVPSSSIACISFACGKSATLIWNVRREIPPSDSFTPRIFSATVSGSPRSSAPVGPSRASNCARVTGGQPRSFPISEKLFSSP